MKIYDIILEEHQVNSVYDYVKGLDWGSIPFSFSGSIYAWMYQATVESVEIYQNRYLNTYLFAPKDQTIQPADLEDRYFLEQLTNHIWLGNTIEYKATKGEIEYLDFVGNRYKITEYLNSNREGNTLYINPEVRYLLEETNGIPPMLGKHTALYDLLVRI